LPVIGVVASGWLSGDPALVITRGPIRVPVAGLDGTWSGMGGRPLFAGSGGMVVTFSGMLSGMGYQRLGVAFSGGIFVSPDVSITSGAVSTPAGNF